MITARYLSAVTLGLVLLVAVGLAAFLWGGFFYEGEAPVERVIWPRFPFDESSRTDRVLAVLYSSDNIGPNTTLARLGYPGRKIFRLHRDHPNLRMVLMSCPANRYSGEKTVLDSPQASETWRALALDEKFDFIELGNQGYTHSPPGDNNLSHHEFSTEQVGCNLDHDAFDSSEYISERFRLIRETYKALGIGNERVLLLRFPGRAYGPKTLKEAARAGFLASLSSGWGNRSHVRWTRDQDWKPFLEIMDTKILGSFAKSDELETGLESGRIRPTDVTDSPEFIRAVERGAAVVEHAAEGGGVLNLTGRWAETFERIGGVYPRYLVLDAVLTSIASRYERRAWYPTGRELVLWLNLSHESAVTLETRSGQMDVFIRPSDRWLAASGPGLDGASVIVTLPKSWDGVESVRLKQGDDPWSDLAPEHFWLDPRGLAVVFPVRGPVRLRLSSS